MQLNSNTIIQLSEGQSASNLNATKLTLYNKNIESIEAGVFDRYKSLEILELNGNKIKELPLGIFHSLRELKVIRLYINKISSLHPQLFKENKKLEEIWVYNNELTELNEKELFQYLPELKKLSFSGNKMKTFDFECLKDSTKLEELWFYNNDLREIKGLDDFKKLFPNLKKCSVHNNNFSCSYMQRVVATFERMNIAIANLDKNKGILLDSVYGLKCIPDKVYPNCRGVELESKVTDTDAKLKQLSDEIIKLRADLNRSNRKINGLEAALDVHHQQNWKLSKYVKEAKEEMLQLIGELQLQQARKDAELIKSNRKINGLEAALAVSQQQNKELAEDNKDIKNEMWKAIKELKHQQAGSDAELKTLKEAKEEMRQEFQCQQTRTDAEMMTLKDELTKNNRKIDELEAAQDVNKQQNLQLRAELKQAKEELWQELQRQQVRTDALLKTLREKTDIADSELIRQIENAKTSANSRSNMLEAKLRTFYALSGEIFELHCDFEIFSDNFKEYNEKIGSQIRKYESQITEWEANMETSLREMQQVMEDHKVSYPKERPLIWDILVQLDEHGNKNQEGLDGLKADFEEHSEEYAKQKTKVDDQLSHCEANLDALQTEMAERGDQMAFLYRTDRPKIFTSLIELKRTSDTLLADYRADKELRALADDKEVE